MLNSVIRKILILTGELIAEGDIKTASKIWWEIIYPECSIAAHPEWYGETTLADLYTAIDGLLRFQGSTSTPYTPEDIAAILNSAKR